MRVISSKCSKVIREEIVGARLVGQHEIHSIVA
jgi:hypothetical protein